MTAHSTGEDVRRQFGAAAAAYATSAVHASGPDLRALVEAARLTGTERVLDMGHGAGHTAIAVAARAASVTAVDLTPEMVEVATALARERGATNATFEVADVANLPFPDGSFDLVTNRLSAHHYPAPQQSLREALRVLRPGGRLLLIDTVAPEDPALDTWLNAVELLRDGSHVRDWRASEWVSMLRAAGFEGVTVLERWGIPLDGADWVKRMQTPPTKVAMLRELVAEATPRVRAAFEVRNEPWGFSIPFALFEAAKPGA
ncbi:MAG TPA: methyltransferase domain-containing protein [Tepidiformaceae bacterium]